MQLILKLLRYKRRGREFQKTDCLSAGFELCKVSVDIKETVN